MNRFTLLTPLSGLVLHILQTAELKVLITMQHSASQLSTLQHLLDRYRSIAACKSFYLFKIMFKTVH